MNDFIPKTDTKVDIQADIPENILNTDVLQAIINEAANYDNITFESSAPQHHCSMPMPIHDNSTTGTVATEMARLFMKKDILMSRLTHFSDKAEHYLIWKAKFLGIMKDLQVTPTEELDKPYSIKTPIVHARQMDRQSSKVQSRKRKHLSAIH